MNRSLLSWVALPCLWFATTAAAPAVVPCNTLICADFKMDGNDSNFILSFSGSSTVACFDRSVELANTDAGNNTFTSCVSGIHCRTLTTISCGCFTKFGSITCGAGHNGICIPTDSGETTLTFSLDDVDGGTPDITLLSHSGCFSVTCDSLSFCGAHPDGSATFTLTGGDPVDAQFTFELSPNNGAATAPELDPSSAAAPAALAMGMALLLADRRRKTGP